MQEMVLYIAVMIAAIISRYLMGMSQACLYVGRTIVDAEAGTGAQDAVTPPLSTNIALITWIIAAVLISFAFWQSGLLAGLIAVAVYFLTTVIIGATVIPKPNSSHFIKIIYNSLVNRVAD